MKTTLGLVTLLLSGFLTTAYAQSTLKSDVPVEIGTGATLTSRNGVREFCSFPDSNYVFRFIVKKNRNAGVLMAVTNVEISQKGSVKNQTVRYDLVGINDSIDPGYMGTQYRVFEKVNGPASMPTYFYHASHPQYTRTSHFFANRVNISTGIPVAKVEESDFYAEVDQWQSSFFCGYEE